MRNLALGFLFGVGNLRPPCNRFMQTTEAMMSGPGGL